MDRDVRLQAIDPRHALSFAELAQVVHDFKSPLSVVALESQVLQHQLDDGKHIDMVNAITRMMLNIDYIDRMIQDLIDSCALDAGQFTLRRSPTDLRALIENVTNRMLTTCSSDRIIVDAPYRLSLEIDALRIERVVANFLQNALKYSPDATQVVVKLDTTKGMARVSVIDAGPGIASDEVDQIFEQYVRAPHARLQEGSGLGLYVSRQIVEAHGGRIGVISVQGRGAEFFFELPLW